MSTTEQVLRRQTKEFINEDPATVVLTRNERVSDGAGGYTTTPAVLDPQPVRVVQSSLSRGTERRNSAGEVVMPTIYLVLLWDADIQRGDTFVWQGLDAEVVWVTALNYVKHAEVAFS